MQIYSTDTTNPFYNLAVEDWLFNHLSIEQPVMFLWQNAPCVVIGRAQNPWQETNLDYLSDHNLPLIRRQSGGGAVYHDLGNLNYTIFCPLDQLDKTANLDMICQVLKEQFNLPVSPSAHHDILLKHPDDQALYKVSGSAFRQTKSGAFHHGTLLIDADKNHLYQALHHPSDTSLKAKGVASRRARVVNLKEINPTLCANSIKQALIDQLATQTPVLSLNQQARSAIQAHQNKLQQWEWRFGKTLPFHKTTCFMGQSITLDVKKGYIQQLSPADAFPELAQWIATNQPRYPIPSQDTIIPSHAPSELSQLYHTLKHLN